MEDNVFSFIIINASWLFLLFNRFFLKVNRLIFKVNNSGLKFFVEWLEFTDQSLKLINTVVKCYFWLILSINWKFFDNTIGFFKVRHSISSFLFFSAAAAAAGTKASQNTKEDFQGKCDEFYGNWTKHKDYSADINDTRNNGFFYIICWVKFSMCQIVTMIKWTGNKPLI